MPSQPDDVVRSAKREGVWSGAACRIYNQWFFRYRLLCESIRGCPHKKFPTIHDSSERSNFRQSYQAPDLRARSSHADCFGSKSKRPFHSIPQRSSQGLVLWGTAFVRGNTLKLSGSDKQSTSLSMVQESS
jgi:hypothetical protein